MYGILYIVGFQLYNCRNWRINRRFSWKLHFNFQKVDCIVEWIGFLFDYHYQLDPSIKLIYIMLLQWLYHKDFNHSSYFNIQWNMFNSWQLKNLFSKYEKYVYFNVWYCVTNSRIMPLNQILYVIKYFEVNHKRDYIYGLILKY